MSGLRVKSAELKELIMKALEAPYRKNIKKRLAPKDLETALRYYPYICYSCEEPIPFFTPKIKHCNITQNPSTKFFCSKSCRDRWVFFPCSKTNCDPALNDLNKNEMVNVWTKLKSNST